MNMKNLLLLLLAAFAFGQITQAQAQTPPYFNSNTATQANVVPFNPTSAIYQKVQDIYAPGEFAGAPNGLINTLWVRMASTSAGAGPYSNFQISMGQNIGTGTTASTTFNSGLTSVYSNASYTTPAVSVGGWIAIPLSTSFAYNPALSLVVEVKSTGVSGVGLNVYRVNATDRRVYGTYAATTGTVFNGPMEIGLSISLIPNVVPPYFNSNTATQANVVPFNPTSAIYQKVQDIYAPGEFAGAPNGLINTLWVRMASTSAGAGPYSNFQISMGQNIGTGTTASTTFNSGLTSVYSNASYTTPAVSVGGWIAIPLSTSFAYNPALSLVVEVKSTGVSGVGLNVYRVNATDRRVYGTYAATTGTVFNGPMEIGLSISLIPNVVPPYFNSNTATQANVVPFNPTSAIYQKVQDIYAPGEFAGAPNGLINTLWVRMASTSAGAGPYSNFQISMGQNIGTGTTASTTFNSGLTSVYSNASYTTPAVSVGGWIAIPLSTSFAYNPALSLVVEVKSTGVSGAGLNIYRVNATDRRVYGTYAATTGTVFNGPMEIGLSFVPVNLIFKDSFE